MTLDHSKSARIGACMILLLISTTALQPVVCFGDTLSMNVVSPSHNPKKIVSFKESYDAFSLAFSPNGSYLATSSPSAQEVHLWDWRNEKLLKRLDNLKAGTPNGLVFSHDGRWLVSAHRPADGLRFARVWDTDKGNLVSEISAANGTGGGAYERLQFTPDDRQLITTQSCIVDSCENIRVFSTGNWAYEWGMKLKSVYVSTISLSTSGRWLAVLGDQLIAASGRNFQQPKVKIIDFATRQVTSSADVFADGCSLKFVAWSPDDKLVAVGARPAISNGPFRWATVELLEAKSGRRLGTYTEEGSSHINALDFTASGENMVIGWDGTVEVWDTFHQRLKQKVMGTISAVAVSQDSTLMAIAQEDGRIDVWTM